MSTPLLIVLRGLPGAGKTTWAKTHHPQAMHIQIDDYYRGDYSLASRRRAHSQCDEALAAALGGPRPYPVVVVERTHLDRTPVDAACELAHYHGCRVEVVTMDTPLETCKARRPHIPEAEWEGMAKAWEARPEWIADEGHTVIGGEG